MSVLIDVDIKRNKLPHVLLKKVSKVMAEVQGYRLFNVQLTRKSVVSPSLLSLVFTGPEVRYMKCDSPDQRIKLLLPSLDGTPSALANDNQWYDALQSMDKERRPVLRTYTLRHLDSAREELTVEFVSHGTEGRASAFAVTAEPGERLQIVAPNAAYSNDSGGYEWAPPVGLRHALIIADETALPAASGILELLAKLPEPPQIQAFFEVPEAGDCIDLSAFSFAKIHWLPRAAVAASYGERLIRGCSSMSGCQQVSSTMTFRKRPKMSCCGIKRPQITESFMAG